MRRAEQVLTSENGFLIEKAFQTVPPHRTSYDPSSAEKVAKGPGKLQGQVAEQKRTKSASEAAVE